MKHTQNPLWTKFAARMTKVGTLHQAWELYKKLRVQEIELILKNIDSWRETERIKGAQEEKENRNLA